MTAFALNPETREHAIEQLTDPIGVDILVIGGGVTGAGIALDAASRGLRVGIVEAQDWASGTSSRSSKLLHGGLRYLQMLDFKLVHEAILERNRLLTTIAPHLAVPVPFIFPLEHAVTERAYVGSGVALYDALALLGGRPAVPGHRHLSRARLAKEFDALDRERFVGAIKYYDARVDDARLVTTLIRTAAHHGALAASRVRVHEITKDASGKVTGVRAHDDLTGTELVIPARHVISATGVWTEQTESLAATEGGLHVLASKGAHIVVPRSRIRGRVGVISQTEKSVLFIIPWQGYWMIGTTDTPYGGDLGHPEPTSEDVDYLLDEANRVLREPITRDDVIGAFAGLRPLLQPDTKGEVLSTKVSREHTVTEPVPGLTVIAGGKLTTYRVMAEDAVDFSLGPRAKQMPSVTKRLPLLGAQGLPGIVAKRSEIGRIYGWDRLRVNRLINRYGTMLYDLLEMIGLDPELGQPLAHAEQYLRAEIAYAASSEGALSLADVMRHRTRLSYEAPDGGAAAAPEVSRILAPILGWTEAERRRQVREYKEWSAAARQAWDPSAD